MSRRLRILFSFLLANSAGLAVSHWAFAREIDSERTVSTEQIQLGQELPKTLVVRNRAGTNQVEVLHLRAALRADESSRQLVSTSSFIRVDTTGRMIGELDRDSSSSSWIFRIVPPPGGYGRNPVDRRDGRVSLPGDESPEETPDEESPRETPREEGSPGRGFPGDDSPDDPSTRPASPSGPAPGHTIPGPRSPTARSPGYGHAGHPNPARTGLPAARSPSYGRSGYGRSTYPSSGRISHPTYRRSGNYERSSRTHTQPRRTVVYGPRYGYRGYSYRYSPYYRYYHNGYYYDYYGWPYTNPYCRRY